MPERVARRVAERVERDERTGCLISTYSTGSHGYAQVGWGEDGRTIMRLAHRVAWETAHGPIPDGATVDHLCHVRRCVNVEHMRLLSNFENSRRTLTVGDWPVSGRCRNGHPDAERIMRAGRSRCPHCLAEWNRRYREKRRARFTPPTVSA